MEEKHSTKTKAPADAATRKVDARSGIHFTDLNTSAESMAMKSSDIHVSQPISDLHLPAAAAVCMGTPHTLYSPPA